jgi:hypothetical protein
VGASPTRASSLARFERYAAHGCLLASQASFLLLYARYALVVAMPQQCDQGTDVGDALCHYTAHGALDGFTAAHIGRDCCCMNLERHSGDCVWSLISL